MRALFRAQDGTGCTSLLRVFCSALMKFTLQFCHLLWVLLTLCPKPSPTWGLSTYSSRSGLFRPQTEGLLWLRRKMAFGKNQYPHIPHLKVRVVVHQCQGPPLVLCHRSLPLRSHSDNQTAVACLCSWPVPCSDTHWGYECLERWEWLQKSGFHLG